MAKVGGRKQGLGRVGGELGLGLGHCLELSVVQEPVSVHVCLLEDTLQVDLHLLSGGPTTTRVGRTTVFGRAIGAIARFHNLRIASLTLRLEICDALRAAGLLQRLVPLDLNPAAELRLLFESPKLLFLGVLKLLRGVMVL